MARVNNYDKVPAGFETSGFAGIGLSCKMMEPSSLSSPSDWELLISELSSWGVVPQPEEIEGTKILHYMWLAQVWMKLFALVHRRRHNGQRQRPK